MLVAVMHWAPRSIAISLRKASYCSWEANHGGACFGIPAAGLDMTRTVRGMQRRPLRRAARRTEDPLRIRHPQHSGPDGHRSGGAPTARHKFLTCNRHRMTVTTNPSSGDSAATKDVADSLRCIVLWVEPFE